MNVLRGYARVIVACLALVVSSCGEHKKKHEAPPSPPPPQEAPHDPIMTNDQIIAEVKKCHDAGLEAQSYGYPDDKGVVGMTTDIQCKVDAVGGNQ